MKKFLFTLIVVCVAQFLRAQRPQLVLSDSSKPTLQQQLLFPERIIGKTKNGTIYALPQDNMPVLVPDSAYLQTMPVSGRTNQIGNLMPNPMYPYKPHPLLFKSKVDSIKLIKPKH